MKKKLILFLTTFMLGSAVVGLSALSAFAEEGEAEEEYVEEVCEPAAEPVVWEETWTEEAPSGGDDIYIAPAEEVPVEEAPVEEAPAVPEDSGYTGEDVTVDSGDIWEEPAAEPVDEPDPDNEETEETALSEDTPAEAAEMEEAETEETVSGIQTFAVTATSASASSGTTSSSSTGTTSSSSTGTKTSSSTTTTTTTTQAKKNGLITENGKLYYYKDGVKQTGLQKVDGKQYYFNSNGSAATGLKKVGDDKYYFSAKDYTMQTGWQTIDGYRYYFNLKSGIMTKGWKKIDDNKYYFGNSGKARTGWRTIEGSRYYFSAKKGIMRTYWRKIGNYRYYFGGNGKLRKNTVAGTSKRGYGIVNSKGRRTAKVDSGAKKMLKKAQSYSSSTNYLLMVDSKKNRVGVFKGSKGNWIIKYYWKAGTGKASTPTVQGQYTVQSKGLYFNGADYTCWYYTQFYGNYLFHSALYYPGSQTRIKESGLGKNVSHGCVRLDIKNAKWIYNNVPYATKVVSYRS